MKNKERVKELLLKLKKVNAVYGTANEGQKERLFNACVKVIVELVELTGEKQEFFEGLIIGGGDFLDSVMGKVEFGGDEAGEIIFS